MLNQALKACADGSRLSDMLTLRLGTLLSSQSWQCHGFVVHNGDVLVSAQCHDDIVIPPAVGGRGSSGAFDVRDDSSPMRSLLRASSSAASLGKALRSGCICVHAISACKTKSLSFRGSEQRCLELFELTRWN